jgi:FkbM family methyltransferase
MITQDDKCLDWIRPFLNLSKERLMVFDLGANSGDFTELFLSKFDGRSFIYSFEPQPDINKELRERFLKNSNVKIIEKAMGSETDTKDFFEPVQVGKKRGSHLSSLINRQVFNEFMKSDKTLSVDKYRVYVTTVDDFCQENNIEVINYLKIDVEGYELEVLKGAKNLLEKKKIVSGQFEIGGTLQDANIEVFDIVKFLNSYDYSVYFTEIKDENKINKPVDFNKITDGWENLLFIDNGVVEKYKEKINNFSWEDM